MSTKNPLKTGQHFQVYQELFEGDSIYLELDSVDFIEVHYEKNGRDLVRIRFSLEQALNMNLVSDENIKKMI